MKSNVLKNILIIITTLIFISISITINASSKYNLYNEYVESDGTFKYLDVSDDRFCIVIDHNLVYEYTYDGEFLRMIEYSTNRVVYAFYDDSSNLNVYSPRQKTCLVFDDNSNLINEYSIEPNAFNDKIDNGYSINEEFTKDFVVNKNGYQIEYINANWFQRFFVGKIPRKNGNLCTEKQCILRQSVYCSFRTV